MDRKEENEIRYSDAPRSLMIARLQADRITADEAVKALGGIVGYMETHTYVLYCMRQVVAQYRDWSDLFKENAVDYALEAKLQWFQNPTEKDCLMKARAFLTMRAFQLERSREEMRSKPQIVEILKNLVVCLDEQPDAAVAAVGFPALDAPYLPESSVKEEWANGRKFFLLSMLEREGSASIEIQLDRPRILSRRTFVSHPILSKDSRIFRGARPVPRPSYFEEIDALLGFDEDDVFVAAGEEEEIEVEFDPEQEKKKVKLLQLQGHRKKESEW